MDRVDETTIDDDDEISFAPAPSPDEARARLAALRGKPLEAPSRLAVVEEVTTPAVPAEEPAAPAAQAVTAAPTMVSVSLPADKMARLLAMLDGEAPKAEQKAEPQKSASAVKKADKPLFKVVKVRITTNVDADVLEAFKATGKGWQTRINDVLRENMP